MTKFEYKGKIYVATGHGHKIWIEDGAGEIEMVYTSVGSEAEAIKKFQGSCPVCHGSGMAGEDRECQSCSW